MRFEVRLLAGAALVAGLLNPSGSSAGTLLPASYDVTLTHHEYLNPEYHNSQSFTGPGTYTLPNTTAVDGSVGGQPGAAAHAYAIVGDNAVSTTNASVIYYFQVTGPDSAVPIPLLVTTYLTESVTFDPYYPSQNQHSSGIPGYVYNASALVEILGTAATASVGCSKVAYSDPSCSSNPIFSGALTLDAVPGTAYEVIVSAFASADSRNAFGSVRTEAFADPQISFAPGFDATGYGIELSEGVGNGAPVPEPHALSMLALTLLALGAAYSSGRFEPGSRRPLKVRNR